MTVAEPDYVILPDYTRLIEVEAGLWHRWVADSNLFETLTCCRSLSKSQTELTYQVTEV
jgi:hypothetical protein